MSLNLSTSSVSNTDNNQSPTIIIITHQHRTVSSSPIAGDTFAPGLLFYETLLWIIQELTELLCFEPQDADKRSHTLQSTFVCPSASRFCSALSHLWSAALHLVPLRGPAASAVVPWSHIIMMGKNKAIKTLSERKLDISWKSCLFHLSGPLSALWKWTLWILWHFQRSFKSSKSVSVAE